MGEQKRAGKAEKRRLNLLGSVFFLMGIVLIGRLYQLQIAEGASFARDFAIRTEKTLTDRGARGAIYDRNGKPLAVNRLVYNLTLTEQDSDVLAEAGGLTLNDLIAKLYRILNRYGDSLESGLYLEVKEDGSWEYTAEGSTLRRFKADAAGKADPDAMTEEEKNRSAQEMMEYLGKRYGIPEPADLEGKKEVLAVAGIRWQLAQHAYRKYVPVTAARNISEETMAFVLENAEALPGVEVEEDWIREYPEGEAFSHILGYTGTVSPEELETLQKENPDYDASSVIGKAGMEQYMEAELRGIDGERKVTVGSMGQILGEEEVLRAPEAGEDVFLSIDADLQKKVYEILERQIAGILADHLTDALSFDKSSLRDTTDIRIPMGDVYAALIENNVIRLPLMRKDTATDLERETIAWLEEETKAAAEQIREELTAGDTPFGALPQEMQDYGSWLVSVWCENRDPEDAADQAFAGGEISLAEFLETALEKGWMKTDGLTFSSKYLTSEERYAEAVRQICRMLREEEAFEKQVFESSIRAGRVGGERLIPLLYAQGILMPDEDWNQWKAGTMSSFALMEKKIRNAEITPAQLALDPCSGSAAVVEAETGKLLACVTYPGYDNNRLVNEMDRAYYNRIYQDRSIPFYNRATQQLSAPGSAFKPVTAAAGLEEKVIAPDSAVVCDGVFDKVVPSLKCWNHAGHGAVTSASEALKHSCNDYLCEISYRLGTMETQEFREEQALKKLQEYSSLFGLDQKSGIELTESAPQVTDRYAIPSAIGQGTHNYTTVQLARYTNVLAERGKVFSLSLLRGTGIRGELQSEIGPKWIRQAELENRTWDTLHSGMQKYAKKNEELKRLEEETGLTSAGKTGTAQESRLRPDHALFIGFAPAEQPEISLAVRITNGYTSAYAVRAGAEILKEIFQ